MYSTMRSHRASLLSAPILKPKNCSGDCSAAAANGRGAAIEAKARTNGAMRATRFMNTSMVRAEAGPYASNIQLFGFFGAFHDESKSRRCVFAHQLVDHPIGHELIGHLDA